MGWFSLWNGYCWLCSSRVGRGTAFGLVCELNTAACVVVEWERERGWFSFWIVYCWLCSVRLGEGQGVFYL
jgi:hypothetical protein